MMGDEINMMQNTNAINIHGNWKVGFRYACGLRVKKLAMGFEKTIQGRIEVRDPIVGKNLAFNRREEEIFRGPLLSKTPELIGHVGENIRVGERLTPNDHAAVVLHDHALQQCRP